FDCDATDLQIISELGRGAFGVVHKVCHRPSGVIMAVKRIRANVSSKDQKYLLQDLDVSMASDSPYTVKVYGALFKEGDVWICMESMEESFDKFYVKVFKQSKRFNEAILCYFANCVIKALSYLHNKLKVIHRDVKPSNILLDLNGLVKLCDFGISGQLVNSIAKTREAGCKPYMAPERINPTNTGGGYDIRSDVWSFGITMLEISTGKFPYAKWRTPFEQLKQVVMDDPPRLPDDGNFSTEYRDFIGQCLQKDVHKRLKYDKLLVGFA
ncbi:uncharacterized protein TRIADDRAFT_21026, partial [Trichoplax adhaerens]